MVITLIIVKYLMEICSLHLLKSLLEVWLQKIEFHMKKTNRIKNQKMTYDFYVNTLLIKFN